MSTSKFSWKNLRVGIHWAEFEWPDANMGSQQEAEYRSWVKFSVKFAIFIGASLRKVLARRSFQFVSLKLWSNHVVTWSHWFHYWRADSPMTDMLASLESVTNSYSMVTSQRYVPAFEYWMLSNVTCDSLERAICMDRIGLSTVSSSIYQWALVHSHVTTRVLV